MRLTNNTPYSVNIIKSDQVKSEKFSSLTSDTLGIAGPSIKGPAFVPKIISDFEENSSATGILNTFEDTFGKITDYKQMPNSIAAVNEWFSQGGAQVAYVRILGAGKNGIPNEQGIVEGSGFLVNDLVVSGSSTPGFAGNNSFSTNNSQENMPGKTVLLSSFFKQKQKYKETSENTIHISSFDDYLSQSNLIQNEDDICELITHTIFCARGCDINIDETELDTPISILHLKNNDFNTLKDLSDDRRFTLNNQKTRYREKYLNTHYKHFLDKGHVVYSKFLPFPAMINKHGLKEAGDLNDNFHNLLLSTNDYQLEDFQSKFKTAQTPWIVSQPLNREGIEDNRENLIEKCLNLFKIYAIDDGTAGNKFRIKITPQVLGNRKNKTFSKFTLTLSMYNKNNNSFKKLLQYRNLNLNPDSKDYIARRIGTEHEYYDFNLQKIVSKGNYSLTNNYIRVEVNKNIEYHKVSIYEIIPCGFMPYPKIDYSIKQVPLHYSTNLLRKSRIEKDLSQNSSWGVAFDNFSITSQQEIVEGRQVIFTCSFDSGSSEDQKAHYYDYTKYYQDNYIQKNRNNWHYATSSQEDTTNSFFHLEKILYPDINSIDNVKKWIYAIYRKDGKKTSDITSIGNNIFSYKYVDIEKLLKSDSTDDSINSEFLSFELFTFGGFDGVNLLDYDKKRMNQNAFVKELENEENSENPNNNKMPTYNSFRISHNILVDDSNCDIDILSFPDVGHHKFNKSISVLSNENRKYLSVLNVPEFSASGILKNYDFYDINYNLPDSQEQQSLNGSIQQDLKNGTNVTVDSTIQNNYNNRFTFNVCNTFEAALRFNSIVHARHVIQPSVLAIRAIAGNISSPLSINRVFTNSGIDYIKVYNLNFNRRNNNNFDRVVKNSLLGNTNINYIVPDTIDNQTFLNLNSQNTSINLRNSLSRHAHNTRIVNNIKKNIKYLIYLEDILFNNISKIINLNNSLNFKIDELLNNYKENNTIKDYYVSFNSGSSDSEISDAYKNIMRTKIAICLYGNSTENIQEFRLDDLFNITQNNLTETADQDIVINTI